MRSRSPILPAALASVVLLVSATSATSGETAMRDCVVLLHGLARSSSSMDEMAEALDADGYVVANVDYPSRDHRIEVLAPMAIDAGLRRCRELGATERIHFVTHSLGGILLRRYTARNEIENLGRTVMLGPPNQGSNAADAMRNVPGFDWLNGPAGLQLGKGEESVPLALGKPDFEFAVIAGDRTIDPITSAVLEDPDDGRVSVSDTRLEGMGDFRVVHASHAFIMKDDEVIVLVRAFLESGRFPDDPGNAR